MPHQCLKCGEIFEEGSSQLLKGCPACGGNRFFFTKQPLDENQREVISQEVNQDLNTKIMDLLVENKDVLDKKGKWISIKPNEIRKMIEGKISEEQQTKEKKPSQEKEPTIQPFDDDHRQTVLKKINQEIDNSDTPETIGIEQPGRYHIDLKGLLEKEPIVIQKDGSYSIHLPSLFKMIEKKE